MTDTLPVGPGAGAPTPPPNPNAQTDLATGIQTATTAAPELASQPGTAVAVASSGGDVATKAQATAQAGKRQAIADAHTSLFGDITGGAANMLHGLAQAANVGLATVQQEYRYLHDVEARHGLTAAMLEGAGIVAGATAGGLVAGPDGVLLGAEGAARIEGALVYKDSWARAANPNYRDPHTGQLVSFGRDVTNYAANQGIIGKSDHGAISGAIDGLADLIADPVALGGKAQTLAREGELGGALGAKFTGLAITPEAVDRARMLYPTYNRALRQIAEMGPTKIAVKFPQFQSIAGTLAEASSADEVHDVFHDLAKSNELLDSTKLPTMSLARTATGALHDAARNMDGRLADNPLLGPRRWADRLEALPGRTYDPERMDFSGTQMSLANTRGLRDLYAMARYGNTDRVAKAVGDAWVAGTVAQRKVIYKNLIFDTIFNMAKQKLPSSDEYVQMLKDASSRDDIQAAIDFRGDKAESYLTELGKGDVVAAVKERLENHLDAAAIEGVNPERVYGIDEFGHTIKGPALSDGEIQAGITRNQTGDVSIPNLKEARNMAAAIRFTRVHRVLAGADDFFYDSVTQGFFKPLVLMSGGYGFHISLAEAIPNALRHGMFNTAGTMYRRALANLGIKFEEASPDDIKGLAGYLWKMGGEKAYDSSEKAQRLADQYVAMRGYKTPVGMQAGEITSGETQPVVRAESGLSQQQAVPTRDSGRWSAMSDNDPRFPDLHHAWLRRNANDPWTQTAARTYLDSMRAGRDRLEATEDARQAVAEDLRAEPEHVLDDHVRSIGKRKDAPKTWDPVDDWAQTIVENMKGSVHGRPVGLDPLGNPIAGPPNMDLLTSLANGHTPELSTVQSLSPAERPLFAPGQIQVPARSGRIQQLANFGFKKFLDPMVNIISRNQEFASEFTRIRESLQAKVDAGIMDDDEAVVRRPTRRRSVHPCASSTTSTHGPSGPRPPATGSPSPSPRSRRTSGREGCWRRHRGPSGATS